MDEWENCFFIPEIESTKEFSTGGELIEYENGPDSLIVTQEFAAQVVNKFLT